MEFAIIGPVHHVQVSQNDVCKARNTNSVVVNISIGDCSILPVSQDDVQTSDLDRIPSKGLADNEHSEHIGDTFHLFSYIEVNVCPDLTSLRTLVIVVVTKLFANTRHYCRH